MIKKSVIVPLVLLFVINILLLSAMYWFLRQQGFDWNSFAISALMYILASSVAGYIVILDVVDSKKKQDDRLIHIAKEMLHEINLPISTIDANLFMLSKNNTNDKAKKRIDRIWGALERLKKLYNELSYSIKKEIVLIKKEEFDLKNIVEERVKVLDDLGRNRFALDLNILDIKADKIGLEQVIDNLLENAIKYSEPESDIEITLLNNVLQIKDHGVGITPEQMIHIYDRYYQGQQSSVGEGIGLALVKHYCDEEGILIDINSTPNHGTTITLDFGNAKVMKQSV